jgi:hypothetical protein
MRPLNWTTTAGAGTSVSSHLTVTLAADPGVYSSNYAYATLGGRSSAGAGGLPTFQAADDPVAAGDYLVFETPDGAYYFDTVSSMAGLVATMTADKPTGGIASGARVWLMGQATDTDPATGVAAHLALLLTASQVNTFTGAGQVVGTAAAAAGTSSEGADLFQALHPYDPVLFYDVNNVAADTLNVLGGYYASA